MDRGVYVAAAGGIGQGKNMEAIVNNLAGSAVVGFKKDAPIFNVYQVPENTTVFPARFPENVFVNVGDIFTDFSPGVLRKTGNPLDAAISGDGFFAVQTPQGRFYTRKGDFAVDGDGRLKTKDGYTVEGEGGVIRLTPGEVSIEQDGTISVNGNTLGKLKIVTFARPYPLVKSGGGLFAASGGAEGVSAKSAAVLQSHLEMSNANAVGEMVSMINALRAYESHMKLIQGFDEIAEKAVRLAKNQ